MRSRARRSCTSIRPTAPPTCTLQAVEFNRAVDDYQAANVALVGVSVDDDESHRCFAADQGLRFPLVSDDGGELTGQGSG